MNSPLLDFSIESFDFAVELFMKKNKTKFTLIHLDNSLELLFKAALLNRGVSIYKENNKKITLDFYDLMKKLEINNGELDILHEERNKLQHTGQSIDSKHIEYYLQATFEFFESFLKREFDLDLKDQINKNKYLFLKNPSEYKINILRENAKSIAMNYFPISIIGSGVKDGKPYCDKLIFKIKQNEHLSWVNDSHIAHTVTTAFIHEDVVNIVDFTEGGFDSGLLLYDDSFDHKFTEKGEYSYLCKIHPWETAKIIVE